MPVGEADKGIGAKKGVIYYGAQTQITNVQWSHGAIGNEDYIHHGSLNGYILLPNIIYGINDKLNLVFNTTIGMRNMIWKTNKHSLHHRSENSLSDFANANGGILGDSKIMLRYIFKNTANQEGYRVFGGFGLTIPSNSELTSDPYFLSENSIKEHRHFSLSDGTYNSNFETQIFYKRNRNPMFVGGFILYENPLHENEYKFLPSSRLIVRLSSTYKRFDKIDSSLGYGISYYHTSKSYWNDKATPNSESVTIAPSISFLFNSKYGAHSLSIQKPYTLSGQLFNNEGEVVDQKTNAWQIVFSIRVI